MKKEPAFLRALFLLDLKSMAAMPRFLSLMHSFQKTTPRLLQSWPMADSKIRNLIGDAVNHLKFIADFLMTKLGLRKQRY